MTLLNRARCSLFLARSLAVCRDSSIRPRQFLPVSVARRTTKIRPIPNLTIMSILILQNGVTCENTCSTGLAAIISRIIELWQFAAHITGYYCAPAHVWNERAIPCSSTYICNRGQLYKKILGFRVDFSGQNCSKIRFETIVSRILH